MATYPQAIQQLIDHFRALPGVGPKTAERFVFHLLRTPPARVQELTRALTELHRAIGRCTVCGTFAESSPCRTCADPRRDRSLLCVVADPPDILAIERTDAFRGVYHVLDGLLAPIEGIGPAQLRIADLLARVSDGGNPIREIVLAFDPTIEGETTVHYLVRALAGRSLRLTRLARGLPVGGDLEYADPITLSDAMSGRREILQPAIPAATAADAPPF